MATNTKKYGMLALLAVLVIGVVLISGCVQQAPTEQEEKPSGVNGAEEGTLEDCIRAIEIVPILSRGPMEYFACAAAYKNPQVCERMKLIVSADSQEMKQTKDACYAYYAASTKDVSACDKISSEEEEKRCREIVESMP